MSKEDFMHSMTSEMCMTGEEFESFYSAVEYAEEMKIKTLKNKKRRSKKND